MPRMLARVGGRDKIHTTMLVVANCVTRGLSWVSLISVRRQSCYIFSRAYAIITICIHMHGYVDKYLFCERLHSWNSAEKLELKASHQTFFLKVCKKVGSRLLGPPPSWGLLQAGVSHQLVFPSSWSLPLSLPPAGVSHRVSHQLQTPIETPTSWGLPSALVSH